MILTTREQAINFGIYAIENDRVLEGLHHDALIGELMHSIRLVFGGYTFEADDLWAIAEVAVQHYNEAE